MPEIDNAAYEEQARKAFEDDPHYLTAVAAMGDRKRVVSEEAIYAAHGIKLIDKGVTIDSRLRDHLLRHKLMKPIDGSLAVADGITPAALGNQAASLFGEQGHLRRLFPFPADQQRAAATLAALDLPAPLAFKLTVARDQRPRLFAHLLATALICHYVSLHIDLTPEEKSDLLLAALAHDLGELHTDSSLLQGGRRLTRDEMRYIYAHPITGFLIAKACMAERTAVAAAVLHHQERMDGSGYPFGLRADDTSRLSRIVSVVDVCASILERFGNSGRLSALMRLNGRKYDPALIALLQKGLGTHADEAEADEADVLPQLKAVAKLFRYWGDFRASFGGKGTPPPLDFLFERMFNLQTMLLQFGFDPDSLQLLRAALADDEKIAGELVAPLNEVRWQLQDLDREIARHAAAMKGLPLHHATALEDWIADLRRYLEQEAVAV